MGYAWLIHTHFKVPITKIVCAHYYPKTNKFIDVRFTKAQVEQWRKSKVSQIWKIRKMKEQDFVCRENVFCNWCGYKENLCPLHNDPTKAKLLLEEARVKAAEEKRKRKLVEKSEGSEKSNTSNDIDSSSET